MRAGSKQILLITIAVLVTVLLYLAPQKVKRKDSPEKASYSFEGKLDEAKSRLKRQEADQVANVEAALAKDPSSIPLNDSLARVWDRLNKPALSAHYYEEVAKAGQGEKNWINVAYRYFDAFKEAGDSAERKMMVEKAINAYKQVLEINPDNLDAKTDLGLCYAEGTSSPMEGIMLLRDVVEKNPNHLTAQFNLGILSVRSGQYEKAVERFEKVLQIDKTNKDARLLLSKTYLMMGKKDLALQNLEKLEDSGDAGFNQEVNTLINQIKNN